MMASVLPRVSVIVPCYNYGHFLTECVESVVRQRGVDVDVLIVDDQSTDGSLATAHRLAEIHSQVRVTQNEQNLGHVGAQNRGLSEVDGEFVVKLDADDMLPEGALARATELLRARPAIGFVYGKPLVFEKSPPPPGDQRVRGYSVWSGPQWIAKLCRRGHNTIMNPEVVIRRSALVRAGGWQPGLEHGDDLNLWLRLAAAGDVGRVNGPHQGCYRIHDASMLRTKFAGLLNDMYARRKSFDLFFADARTALADGRTLQAAFHRTLAAEAIDHVCAAYDNGTWATTPVEDFIAFAAETYPQFTEFRQWRVLQRRRAGVDRTSIWPQVVLARVARDLRDRVRWRRWQRTGL
jgi:glycosyltransferase involved in cell wall biosynthesis